MNVGQSSAFRDVEAGVLEGPVVSAWAAVYKCNA